MKITEVGLALVIASLSIAIPACAETSLPAYAPGRVIASASLGFGVSGFYGDAQSPLVAVNGEYGLNDVISLGGTLGRSSSSQHYGYFGDAWDISWSYTVLAVRGSYHLAEMIDNEKIDIYGGLSLGYNNVSVKSGRYDVVSGSYVLYGLYAGGRYFFTDRVGAFAELGLGLGNLALGVSTRF